MLPGVLSFCLLRRSVTLQISTRSLACTPSICRAQLLTINRYPSHPKPAEKIPADRGCPLCRAGLHRFGYRDVLLLRQFLTPDGYLMGRRHSGVCPKMQRRIAKAIRRSRQLGLLPNFKSNTPSAETATS